MLRHTLVALLAVHAAALQLTVIEQTLHARQKSKSDPAAQSLVCIELAI